MVAIGKEVRGFWNIILSFFGAKPKPAVAKPTAKPKKSEFVSVDETQVKVDIVKNLTEFFRLQEQLAEHIREEEEKSRTVFDPDQNHMEAALKRVMAQQEMERLVVQIRECMVYQSPPELGALYTEVEAMMKVMGKQQKALIAQQLKDEHVRAVRRRRHMDAIWANAIWGIVAVVIACAFGLAMAYVIQDRIAKYPQLGTGIIPKTEEQRRLEALAKQYVGR